MTLFIDIPTGLIVFFHTHPCYYLKGFIFVATILKIKKKSKHGAEFSSSCIEIPLSTDLHEKMFI